MKGKCVLAGMIILLLSIFLILVLIYSYFEINLLKLFFMLRLKQKFASHASACCVRSHTTFILNTLR